MGVRRAAGAGLLGLLLSTLPGMVVAGSAFARGAAPGAVEVSGARTAGARGLVLSFIGAAPVHGRNDGCGRDYRVSARASGRTVRVAVRPVSRGRLPDGSACVDLGVARTATVRLARPLGDRALVDAATGTAVPVFDGSTRLAPSWLPAGWTAQGEGGGGCWSSDPVPCWQQQWGTPEREDATSCPPGTGFVQLAQAVGGPDPEAFAPDPAVTVTPVTVRGVPAELRVDPRGPGTVTVRWTEGSQSVVLSGGSACSGAPGPAPDVVVRIADGLR